MAQLPAARNRLWIAAAYRLADKTVLYALGAGMPRTAGYGAWEQVPLTLYRQVVRARFLHRSFRRTLSLPEAFSHNLHKT